MKKGTEVPFVCFAFAALSLVWAANVNDKLTARVPAQVWIGPERIEKDFPVLHFSFREG
jgi:hypothetical protein